LAVTWRRTEASGPADLAQWGLHCYCPTARRTPQAVIAEGSNGRLLYAARDGVDRQGLRAAGLTPSDDQLATLVEFGLLRVLDGQFRTAFPVLDNADTMLLRQRLRPIGEALAARLTPQVRELGEELRRQGLAGSSYAVVFGHALDGLLWDHIAATGALPDTTLSADRPWWNGAFWAVYPPREDAAGTNFVDCGAATLVMVWTGATLDRLDALAAAPGLRRAVLGLLSNDPAAHTGEIADGTGRPWRLRLPDGRSAVPILGIDGRTDRIADRLAEQVATAVTGAEVRAATARVPGDEAVATVIVAHELIWHITEALIASGAVALPACVSGPGPDDTPTELLFLLVSG
jgi:hypothetical protein